jgi:hypothetical protein
MPDEIPHLAREIAARLEEPNAELIAVIIGQIGAARAHDLLQQTLAAEATGGLLVHSGKRRRTPGGVFFKLAKDSTSPEERHVIWPRRERTDDERQPLAWDDRLAHAPQLLAARGTAMSTKLVITGRPGRIIESQGVILTAMQAGERRPTLPKGLPEPPAGGTTYIVYIAAKQWAKVAQAIQDPGDALIVEGYPYFDAKLNSMALLAQNVTTRNLQRTQRAAEEG